MSCLHTYYGAEHLKTQGCNGPWESEDFRMPHVLCVSTLSSWGKCSEKATSTSHMGNCRKEGELCHHPPFDIKIIFNRRLKPSSSINEISSIIPRMIDWKVLYLQENHGDRIQLPLLKHFPLKKKIIAMYKNSSRCESTAW